MSLSVTILTPHYYSTPRSHPFCYALDVYHLAGDSLALLLTFNKIYILLKYYPSLSFFTYSAKSRAACITGTDTAAEKGTVKVLLRTVSHKFLKNIIV